MRTFFVVPLLLSLAACAGAQYAERTQPLPPTAPPALVPRHQDGKPLPPADNAATRAWLDQEIERNRYVPPPPPPVEVVERVVERPVYYEGSYDYGAYGYYRDPYYHRYYRGPYRHGYYQPYRSTFPLHTALGAGIGAVVGHQSGHRGRGAWIGGGLGLLMDLHSHW